MPIFQCIKDNSYDGVQAYRKPKLYTFPSNPNSSFFTLVSAGNADQIKTAESPLLAWKDAENDYHVDYDVQFTGVASFDNDVVFDNIAGDAGIQKHVAWHSGTGVIDLTTPGITVTGNDEFTVHAGSANFLDLTDRDNPTIKNVDWSDITRVTDPYVATNLRTAVAIDSDGAVFLAPDELTSEQRRSYAFIGLLTHTDGATITQSNPIPAISVDVANKAIDICEAIKFTNLSGNIYSGVSDSDNTIAVSSGKTFSCDRNFIENKNDPNVTSQAEDDPISSFFVAYRDGSGGATISTAVAVDATKYDDGTGTIATLDDGFWVTHRIYRSTTTGTTLLVYGQSTHKGRTEALTEIGVENFDPVPGSEELILRCFLTIKQGVTGLITPENAVFTPADKWGVTTANRPSNGFDVGVPSFKSYAFTSRGISSGQYYAAGYYQASDTDANLSQVAPTIAYGTANTSYAAHSFIVAGGPGTVDTGQVGLRASYTKIDDEGVRTVAFQEVLTDDITTLSLNEYIEADKCLGPVVFDLFTVSGSPTTYSLDFNYGLAKYEDFGNRNFMVTDFEVTGFGDGNDSDFDVELLEHSPTGWTYSAAGFVPGNGAICSLGVDHSLDDSVQNNQNFAYKRANLNRPVASSGIGGIVVRITTTNNSTVQVMTAHLGVEF